ncbi:MAG TPA: hypothetical protein VEL03_03245 [Streptosporangiaceae bacterium]|nr:hypothetical protein [Streptosporangiaceae bacterium]
MAPDAATESRLRELLRDPGWSLEAWPDTQSRLRRTARRQRVRAASAAASVTAITSVVLIAVLTAFQASAARPIPGGTPAAAYALPGVGAAGFPASVYPSSSGFGQLDAAGHCPDPVGLQQPGPAMRSRADAMVVGLGRSFESDLHSTDRAYWPQVLASWRSRAARPSRSVQVQYSGPLQSRAVRGAPALSRVVRERCGYRTALDTWLVVVRPAHDRAPVSEFLLLDRRGHVLIWNAR